MRVVVLGSGGLAREFAMWAQDAGVVVDAFVNDLDPSKGIGFDGEALFIVGVGKPENKATMVGKALDAGWKPHPAIIHPSAVVKSSLPDGVLVAPGCVITCDVTIGEYSTFNLNTTVGHDTVIGQGCTTNPGVHISGNIRIGDWCEFGTGSVVRDGIMICDNVRIGASGAVVKHITEPGIYVGVPCVRLK
jgi:UDP-3-O-[3-hydroxymyristoyl] glucosamine N-acyltransferase